MVDFFELQDELLRAKKDPGQAAATAPQAAPKAPAHKPSASFTRRQKWAELLKTRALQSKD